MGGAEFQARHTVQHLRRVGVDARVLTTCVADFRSDWAVNALPKGEARVGEVPVERFPADKRDWRLFDQVNLRIMRGEPVTEPEARVYVEESIRSRALEERLARLGPDETVVYMPYLHGTAYWGMRQRPGFLLPCLHDEPYAQLAPFREQFARATGVLCNSRAEAELVEQLFGVPGLAVGEGVATDVTGDGARFRRSTASTDHSCCMWGGTITGRGSTRCSASLSGMTARLGWCGSELVRFRGGPTQSTSGSCQSRTSSTHTLPRRRSAFRDE